jgi:hypothetical protein
MVVVKQNPLFEKALALLAHPLSLAALSLLLVNDQVLRRLWPSWLTGKLGDAAWLFFMPYALAAVLAWFFPLGRRAAAPFFRKTGANVPAESVLFALSFGITGGVFLLVKTLPLAHEWVLRGLAELLKAPPALVRDPTDLLALPALFASAWMWRRTGQAAQPRRAALGMAALPLAVLLSLANAGMPDPGIACLEQVNGRIHASAGYHTYSSTDGGETWSYEPGLFCQSDEAQPGQWREIEAPGGGLRYRYQPGQPIEASTDGGQTWETALDWRPVTESQMAYYMRTRPNVVYRPAPLDALADANSGNVLFAMGHQGVLVVDADRRWAWTMEEHYQPVRNGLPPDAFGLVLGGMVPPTALAVLLVFCGLALRWTFHPVRVGVLVLGLLVWGFVMIWASPAAAAGYGLLISNFILLGAGLLLFPLALEQSVRLARQAPRMLLPLWGTALVAGLMFFLPFVLWLYNALPRLGWATAFAVALALGVLAAGWRLLASGRPPGKFW